MLAMILVVKLVKRLKDHINTSVFRTFCCFTASCSLLPVAVFIHSLLLGLLVLITVFRTFKVNKFLKDKLETFIIAFFFKHWRKKQDEKITSIFEV